MFVVLQYVPFTVAKILKALAVSLSHFEPGTITSDSPN